MGQLRGGQLAAAPTVPGAAEGRQRQTALRAGRPGALVHQPRETPGVHGPDCGRAETRAFDIGNQLRGRAAVAADQVDSGVPVQLPRAGRTRGELRARVRSEYPEPGDELGPARAAAERVQPAVPEPVTLQRAEGATDDRRPVAEGRELLFGPAAASPGAAADSGPDAGAGGD